MHHTEHKTWFPFILIGLTLALLLVIAVFRAPSEVQEVSDSESAVEIIEVSEDEYKASVVSILNNQVQSKDYSNAYEALLNVLVPVTYKDLHLELTIAIAQLRDGNIDEGQARLDLVQAQTDWLP